jgi:hypothetical protein
MEAKMRTLSIVLVVFLIASVAVADKKIYVEPVPSGTRALDCSNAMQINCGDVVTGTTVGGPNNVTAYSCVGWNEGGPEAVYELVLSAAATQVTGTISDLAVDLDIFFLGSCDENDCLEYGNTTFASDAMPAGTYYIVVDGYGTAEGSFTLTVDCLEITPPCGPFEFDCYLYDFNADPPMFYTECGLGPNPWGWGFDAGIPQIACDDVAVTNILGTGIGGTYEVSVGGIAEVGEFFIDDECTCLELCHYYDCETNYDGGNVKVSVDGGLTWELITPHEGYPGMNTSSYYPCECVHQEPIFTGDSGGFVQSFFDISNYVGQTIVVGLFFGSESYATSDLGWYVKWVKIGGSEPTPVEDTTWGTIKSMYR